MYITIHQALSEIKTLDARIEKEIRRSSDMFVATKKASAKNIKGEKVEDFNQHARSIYSSITALIHRRDAIKAAVVKSNANTIINVCGKEYTVAHAIDYKNLTLRYIDNLRASIADQYAAAKRVAANNNGISLDERADDYIRTLFGTKDRKDLGEEAENARNVFIAQQSTEIVDPLNAAVTVDSLVDTIERLKTEIDSALSVSNAVTTIEVDD